MLKIYNLVINGVVVYVGKTKNVEQRYRQHKYLLIHNKHQNKYLQSMYNRYKMFDMVIVNNDATDRDEQIEINKHNTKQRMNRAEPGANELKELHKKIYG